MNAPKDSLKILIVDDDRLSSMLLRRNLELAGHEIVIMEDGEAAWERLQSEDFRLVITDWMMPGVSGIELCRRVRARQSSLHYTYVILLTARSEHHDKAECYDAGADDFLAKPFERGELLARVAAAQRILAMQENLHRRSQLVDVMSNELQRHCAKLAEVTTTDDLTGLKNRGHFAEALETAFSFASRHRLPLSVVMLDVDYFKSFNDTFGHPAGDAALCAIGRILRGRARDHDVTARYGGEEFALILPGTDALGASLFAERLRAQVESHDWTTRPLTASFGAATSTVRTIQARQLVAEADRALLDAKRRGRNRVSHFEEVDAVAV